MNSNESLTAYLERIYAIPDSRPCQHVWKEDVHPTPGVLGYVLRCVRCDDWKERDPSPAD